MVNITSINIYKRDFEEFYDWLIQRGVVKNNICNSELLSTEKIMSYISKNNIVYYEPDDIDEICKWFVHNREYDEVIVRSMYEGVVVDLMELAAVKIDDIDFKQKIYTNKNGVAKEISERLSFLMKVMITKNEYFTNDERRFNMIHYENYLMPIIKTEKKNTSDYVRNTYNNLYYELRRCERKCGRKIVGRTLYDSGMLYRVIQQLGGKENFVHEMLEKRSSKALTKAIADANYQILTNKFKYVYKPHAVYFKSQLNEEK